MVYPAFKLEAQFREYVWGGQRLRPGRLTAETWAVYAGNRITTGPFVGQTLDEAAQADPAGVLGRAAAAAARQAAAAELAAAGQQRFPLLIKLLDCAQWLSLQVHPNDEQAAFLEGPGHSGKTEAWHVLQADSGAEILCGFEPGAPREAVLQSVRDGTVMEYTRRVPVHSGETVFIRAGTLHALGPGLLVYEVQQTSDITYRVFDWNRPVSAGRKLHIEQSLAVLDPAAYADPLPPLPFIDGGASRLVTCPYFSLDLLNTASQPIALNTQGATFHALTVVEGAAEITGDGWSLPLGLYESAIAPAGAGAYRVQPSGRARLLLASVPAAAGL